MELAAAFAVTRPSHVACTHVRLGGGAVTVTGRAVLLAPVPAHRYPAEHCKGKADKYTAYEDAKRTHQEQQQAVKEQQEQSAATTE